jgi:hypothetical protein
MVDIKSHKSVQIGSGSVIPDYGSKDPKEIFYGSTKLVSGTFISKIFGSQGFHFENMRRKLTALPRGNFL